MTLDAVRPTPTLKRPRGGSTVRPRWMPKLIVIVLVAALVAPALRAESGAAAGQDCWMTEEELNEAVELARELVADGDFDRALVWSRRVAEHGHVIGQLFLGLLLVERGMRPLGDAKRRGADTSDPAGLVEAAALIEGYAWLHLVTPGKLRKQYPYDSRIGILRLMDDVQTGRAGASQLLTPEQVEQAEALSRTLVVGSVCRP